LSSSPLPQPPKRDRRLDKALDQLKQLLVPGETIEAYAVQRRLFALLNRRTVVAATSGRLIGMQRGVLGGMSATSVRWQDLKDARIHVLILGFSAKLTISFFVAPDLAISGSSTPELTFIGLERNQAQSIYRMCQAQDQAWREKRRIRELEEMRARSGGMQFAIPGTTAPIASSATSQEDAVVRLEKAKAMLDKGLISDAEFESLKARIVNSL
jgi:hypothetical protein